MSGWLTEIGGMIGRTSEEALETLDTNTMELGFRGTRTRGQSEEAALGRGGDEGVGERHPMRCTRSAEEAATRPAVVTPSENREA